MPEFTPPLLASLSRPTKWHHLKCDSEPFAAVSLGIKKSEFRLNDRGFENGDAIVLHEQERGKLTGRTQSAVITHIQTGYGIPDG